MQPERLRAAAELLAGYPFRVWHYGESTGLEGLLAAADLLDEPRYASWVHGLLRGWAARRRPFAEIDNTLPGKVLCRVAAARGDELLLEAARDAAAYLSARPQLHGVSVPFRRAPLREPFGGGQLGAGDRALLADPGPGVFVDCLHFDPPFLVELGVSAALLSWSTPEPPRPSPSASCFRTPPVCSGISSSNAVASATGWAGGVARAGLCSDWWTCSSAFR